MMPVERILPTPEAAELVDLVSEIAREKLAPRAAAAEEAGEPAVNPWVIGGGAFLVLLLLLIGVVAFGGGRDHS